MAIFNTKIEKGFRAGDFLAKEECRRVTTQVALTNAEELSDGSYFYHAGGVLLTTTGTGNDAVTTLDGIIYEDVVYVADGESDKGAVISVVTEGTVYADKLVDVSDGEPFSSGDLADIVALEGKIKFETHPTVTRPEVESEGD